MDTDRAAHYASIILTLVLAIAGVVMLFMNNDKGMTLIGLAVPSSGLAARSARGINNDPD
jgi:hypothetical protein